MLTWRWFLIFVLTLSAQEAITGTYQYLQEQRESFVIIWELPPIGNLSDKNRESELAREQFNHYTPLIYFLAKEVQEKIDLSEKIISQIKRL